MVEKGEAEALTSPKIPYDTYDASSIIAADSTNKTAKRIDRNVDGAPLSLRGGAYYDALKQVRGNYEGSRPHLRRAIYSLAVIAAGAWVMADQGLPITASYVTALLIIGVLFYAGITLVPRAEALLALRGMNRQAAEECADYLEKHYTTSQMELIERMAENDRAGIQSASALVNTVWPALVGLIVAGIVLPPSLTIYLIAAGVVIFGVVPLCLVANLEQEQADIAILQATVLCRERQYLLCEAANSK
jgi:hypothetical protein